MLWSFGPEADPSSQYRLRFPAGVLMSQGADITLDARGPIILWSEEWHGAEPPEHVQALGLAQRPEADIIVLQRPGLRYWADIIPMLQKLGIRVVVDVDDLFDRIDKRNVAHKAYDSNKSTTHNHNWVEEACRRADMVTCTTEALKKRYGFGHGHVLPNLVPQDYLSVEADIRPATVGWTGSIGVHPQDLQVTKGAAAKAVTDLGWDFHIVGTGIGVKKALQLAEEPTNTGYVPFPDYPAAIAEISLGIVPLVDSAFNRAKSCLKMIEFASTGVPVLASATPDNLRMRELGVGAVVNHPNQWGRKLRQLMTNRDYRDDVAGRSREAMRKHTYDEQAWRWGFAWGLERERASVG